MAKKAKSVSAKTTPTPKRKTVVSAKKNAPTKTAPKKKVVTKKVEVQKVEIVKQASASTKLPTFTEVFTKKTMIILGVVAIIGLLYSFRGAFLAATVNGKPITRYQIMKEAEKAQGAQLLENLVLEELVTQEAKAKGIQITDEAIDAQIEEIRQNVVDQGQDFDQLLAMQNLTLEDLREQVEQWQIIEELVSSDTEVTDEQIDAYIEENKDFLPEGMSEEEIRETVTEQLKQQEMSTRYQQWSDDVRSKAKINYFGQYIQEEEELQITE